MAGMSSPLSGGFLLEVIQREDGEERGENERVRSLDPGRCPNDSYTLRIPREVIHSR